MRPEFIETANAKKFYEICNELADPASMVGPSLAMVTGQAGRGKTEAARQYAVNTDAVYIPPLNIRSPAMLLREIAFELASVRPGRSEACLEIIGSEMSKHRRLIIIDEADLLAMINLEMLRNVNERYACPILLIGEETLKGKIASRRRLASRVRRRMEFTPITQQDISFFFKQTIAKISAEVAGEIHKFSKGDWRPVLTVAVGIERAMKASGLTEIIPGMVADVIKNT